MIMPCVIASVKPQNVVVYLGGIFWLQVVLIKCQRLTAPFLESSWDLEKAVWLRASLHVRDVVVVTTIGLPANGSMERRIDPESHLRHLPFARCSEFPA